MLRVSAIIMAMVCSAVVTTHHNASFGCRRNVNVVESDTRTSDHLQIPGGSQDIFGNFGCTTNDQGIVFSDDTFEFFGRQSGIDIYFYLRFFLEHFNTGISEYIADKYLHHILQN
jgi:hypothetical protein